MEFDANAAAEKSILIEPMSYILCVGKLIGWVIGAKDREPFTCVCIKPRISLGQFQKDL